MSPTGSFHSTVIDAGKYDGALGIIAALAALQTIRDTNTDLKLAGRQNRHSKAAILSEKLFGLPGGI